MSTPLWLSLSSASALLLLCSGASAQDSPGSVPGRPIASPTPAPGQNPSGPSLTVGGHLGAAVIIGTVANHTTVIGRDFATIGLTPGLTVHLDDRWSIDFEFIAFNEAKKSPSVTTFVVDPGVVRKFNGFAAGLRVATQVGAPTNIGLVPIVVVPFKITDRLSYFVEGDVPLFLRDTGTRAQPSATFLFQTGVGF